MIITCDQCDKKFEIQSSLIPKKGRLLQCSSCNHKWFFKNVISEDPKIILDEENAKTKKVQSAVKDNNINVLNDLKSSKNTKRKHSYSQRENVKLSSLNVILVFIISIIALIILLDTFKGPISNIIPNIEFILESLYETLKDVLLFIQDLF